MKYPVRINPKLAAVDIRELNLGGILESKLRKLGINTFYDSVAREIQWYHKNGLNSEEIRQIISHTVSYGILFEGKSKAK